MAVIYGLTDPCTGEVRYIGKANNAANRLKGHHREASKGRRRTPLYSWMRKLASEGGQPRLVILERCDGDWREAERRLIGQARERGDRILNLADGGDEPFCPPDVRAANGPKAVLAREATATARRIWELKRNMGQHLRDGTASNYARARLREAARIAPHLFGEYASLADKVA